MKLSHFCPIRAASRKTAFTLVELLVVIAVIVILASILFPVFARARENARRAACQSNMKQLGLAYMQYTQDYDEKLPHIDPSATDAVQDFGNTGSLSNPYRSLQPYAKSTGIYHCPSAVSSTVASYAVVPGVSDASYYENGVITWIGLAAIGQASGLILTHEAPLRTNSWGQRPTTRSATFCIGANAGKFAYWHYTPSGVTQYDMRHFDGANILYADGHVKFRRVSSLTNGDFGLAPAASGPTGDGSTCLSKDSTLVG